jgi:hypothetical protein
MNEKIKLNQNSTNWKKILILPELNAWYLQIIYFFILSVYGIKRMVGSGRHKILVTTSNLRIKRKLQEVSVPCKSFHEYGKDIRLGEMWNHPRQSPEDIWATSRENSWSEIMNRDSVNDIMSFRDVSFLEPIVFESKKLSNVIRKSIKAVETVENIINIEAPDEIVVLNSRQIREKAALEVAKSRGIKVSVLLPLMVSDFIYFFIDFIRLLRIRRNNFKRTFLRQARRFSKFERQTKRNTDRTIIMFQNYSVTAPQFVSVIKELRKNKESKVIVFCIKKSDQEILIRENIDFKEFNYFIDKRGSQRIDQAQRFMNEEWNCLIHSPRLQKLMKYRDIKLLDVMKSELLNPFSRTFFEFVEALEYLRSIDKLDLIAVGSDRRPHEKLSIHFGKLNQVPTLNIQYAAGAQTQMAFKVGSVKLISDKMAVWGKVFKDAFVKLGIKSKKVVVTGNPRFDILINLKKSFNKESFKKDKKISPDKKVLLVATGPLSYKSYEDNWNEIIEEMVIFYQTLGRIIEKTPDLQIIFKPHPRDNFEFFRDIVREVPNSIVFGKEIDTYELVCACDVLITKNSTVGFEAMVLEKPVICFDFIGRLERNEYVSSGAAIGVSDIEELEPAIKNAVENQDVMKNLRNMQKKFVYERGYKLDGHSSRRVADLICDMVEKSHN